VRKEKLLCCDEGDKVSIFATGDYTTNLGGDKRRVLEGNLGFSVKW
jgi:hypothetical protein